MGLDHDHSTSNQSNKKTVLISFIIITGYMLIEFIGGILTNSLALIADAGHMLSDAVSLLITLAAFHYSQKLANPKKTFGYRRFEILAAFINGVTLISYSGIIVYEAIGRFSTPATIASANMFIIASIGLLVNILVILLMKRGADVKENLNMRGAYLHVISDLLGSVGAIIAAVLIYYWNWTWADPLASILVSILIIRSGYFITKSAVDVLMEGTPKNISAEQITEIFLETDEIQSIHDLHIWTITSGMNALTVHAVVDSNLTIAEGEKIVRALNHKIVNLKINHVTIQLESATHPQDSAIICKLRSDVSTDNHFH